MAAGKPVVTLVTQEALETSIATTFVPLWSGAIGTAADQAAVRAMFSEPDGRSRVPFVDTHAAYEGLAFRLIDDPDYRTRVGQACRQFVNRFFRDEKRLAETTAREIQAIIESSQPHAAR
jgi:hypothetical protein